MSRSSRSDRFAQLKGRPKRRAASTHFFKYQLAKNPSRAEENALKKALQESLEEQRDSPAETPVATDKSLTHGKKNRATNSSSTNSSDASKISNISSSTSNLSRDSLNGSGITKRTRSGTSSPNTTSLSNKRVKLNTDKVKHKSDCSGSSNSTTNNDYKDKCDKVSSVLSGSPPPPVNRVIRTYSRSQHLNGHNNTGQQKCQPDMAPRSSTPIAKKQVTPDAKSTTNGTKTMDKASQVSVSRSTQTSASIVKTGNNQAQVNGRNLTTDDKELSSQPQSSQMTNNSNSSITSQPMPVTDKYLKFKRESKNYAYAKMTALKVNTYKSPYGQSKSTTLKKTSPTGVLNSSNKNSSKTSPKGTKNSTPNQLVLHNSESEPRSSKKSPTPNTNRGGSHQEKLSDSSRSTKTIPKHLNASSQGSKSDYSSNNTKDLSNIEYQSQANVNVTKKRIAHGSWSLLGVPEDKLIYLRDDEPPRRLICYPAIKHVEGDVIQVRDSVLLRSGAKTTDLPFIAKVCAFWEDAETGGVMMSLFWYYRPEHTEEGRKPHHLPDEIFASRHRDVDSVECIEDKCYVLTFNEYCRYRKRIKMEQVGATWSLADVTIPVSNESYPRRNRIPDSNANPELVFCCRQIYDSRMKRLIKNPFLNPKYGQ